jgi:SAM-dependent MidA family methyltransferase
MRDVLRNLLQYGDLSFRDFVEVALYHPESGYYARPENPVGKTGDYVTAPTLSPAFSFALGGLVREFLRACEGEVCSVVDIGCGDGTLIRNLANPEAKFFGVDRSLNRIHPSPYVTYVPSVPSVPDGPQLLICNELFDAFPFARLVQRGEHLHELWVSEREGTLDWTEHEAPAQYEDYFAARNIELADGQYVDVSLEWEAYYEDLARQLKRGLIVTLDYGFPEEKLFDRRIRRFGTAAAYSGHRVSRDLLADPGEQDLTAHINFTDLQRAGERQGMTTLFFDRLNKFLLGLNITEHPLFQPGEGDWESRDEARRLVLPDGIGEDLRVLVQGKNVPMEGWSFQKRLF